MLITFVLSYKVESANKRIEVKTDERLHWWNEVSQMESMLHLSAVLFLDSYQALELLNVILDAVVD